MARSPKQSFTQIALLYRDAHKVHLEIEEIKPEFILKWANKPSLEKWAEFQVRYHGWSWFAVEAVVRQCRSNISRAETYVREERGE